MAAVISSFDAIVLGIVEGITEFLPISSTGHLILVTQFLGLNMADPKIKAGVDAFNVVIQSGAILAVIGLYLSAVRDMWQGLLGRHQAGRTLLINLIVAFMPVVIVGPLASGWIKRHLFGPWPVMAAMAVGGVLMIAVETWRIRKAGRPDRATNMGLSLRAMTPGAAVTIGLAQCLAMWPGTSRSMITMVAALILGFKPKAAAEFSFLLAMPTLLAATAHDFYKEGRGILEVSGWLGLSLGFIISLIVALLAVKWFVNFLTSHGLKIFGWYRLALATAIFFILCR